MRSRAPRTRREAERLSALKVAQAFELVDDMGHHVVVPNRDPGKLRSS
jgi:hypothetical protein